MCSRIDMQTHAGWLGLGFNLLTSGSVHAQVLSWTMSTYFGADSSSRFPFRARTNRQMRLNALFRASGYTAGVGNNSKCNTFL